MREYIRSLPPAGASILTSMQASKHNQQTLRESGAERASRVLRNINALGALAFGAAAVLAPPVAAGGLGVLAGVNAAQAAGFEWLRNRARKSHHATKAP